MRFVNPIFVEDSNLVSTSIPEDDYPEWVAGSYTVGDKVMKLSTHLIYECTVNTSEDPELGVLGPIPTWLSLGATNARRMFDGTISSQSTSSSDVVVVFQPGRVSNSIGGFNLEGVASVNIRMVDPLEGEVYNNDVPMNDNTGVTDWYSYFFEPISRKTDFVVMDLPPYGGATIYVTFGIPTMGSIGELVFGNARVIGIANHGTSLQLLDFSIKERDDFGAFTITRRNTSKLVNFDVTIETSRVGYSFSQLSKLSTVLMIWVATEEEDDPTLSYGFCQDFRVDIITPTISSCTIEVENVI